MVTASVAMANRATLISLLIFNAVNLVWYKFSAFF